MRTHEAHEGRMPAGHSGHRRRLLPLVGGGVAAAAVLAHFLGGGLLMHVGLPALLVYFGLGASPVNLGGGVLVVAVAAVVAVKLLLIFGARRWLRHR